MMEQLHHRARSDASHLHTSNKSVAFVRGISLNYIATYYYVIILCITHDNEVLNSCTDYFDRLRNVCYQFSLLYILVEDDQLGHLVSVCGGGRWWVVSEWVG